MLEERKNAYQKDILWLLCIFLCFLGTKGQHSLWIIGPRTILWVSRYTIVPGRNFAQFLQKLPQGPATYPWELCNLFNHKVHAARWWLLARGVLDTGPRQWFRNRPLKVCLSLSNHKSCAILTIPSAARKRQQSWMCLMNVPSGKLRYPKMISTHCPIVVSTNPRT